MTALSVSYSLPFSIVDFYKNDSNRPRLLQAVVRVSFIIFKNHYLFSFVLILSLFAKGAGLGLVEYGPAPRRSSINHYSFYHKTLSIEIIHILFKHPNDADVRADDVSSRPAQSSRSHSQVGFRPHH